MRGLFLPKENIGFIMSHRSGSRLILSSLKYFFDFSNIKYEYIDYHRVNDYTNKYNKSKFYIITRQPLERFLSGFSWLMKNINNDEYSFYFEKYKLETISDFVINYETIMKEDPNAHFLPQTYGILSLVNTFDLNEFKTFNFRRRFDEMFYDYKIIHLEDIDQLVLEDLKMSVKNTVKDTNGLIAEFKSVALRIFDHFYDSDETLRNKFLFSYLMCKNHLEKNHNVNHKILIQSSDYQYLTDFFYDEVVFYGYNNFDVSGRVMKPEEINLKNII